MDYVIVIVLLFIFGLVMVIGKNYRMGMILLSFVFINGFFSLFTFIFPTLPIDKIIPTQIWINAILVFSVLLPQTSAPFLLNL